MRYTLRKTEKLRHKTLVDGLFAQGKSIYEYPLRLNYRMLNDQELADSFRIKTPDDIGVMQMMITVPKKKLKRAVDRVRMRRLIREAYRLYRHELKEQMEDNKEIRTLSMAFVYLHNDKMEYASIEKKMRKLLSRMGKELGTTPTTSATNP